MIHARESLDWKAASFWGRHIWHAGLRWVSLGFIGMRQWLINQRRFGIWATHRILIFLISRDFIYYLFGWSWWILIGCCRISYIAFPWISMKYCTHALQPIATSPCFMIFFVSTRRLMNVKYMNFRLDSGVLMVLAFTKCWSAKLRRWYREWQMSMWWIEISICRSIYIYIFLEDVSYW